MLAYERQLSNTKVMTMYGWLKHVQRRLFPATCVLCGCDAAGELDLCDACRADLPRVLRPCPRCGLPLATETENECGSCVADPPGFTRTLVPFRYDEPIKHLIHALKFNQKLYVARVLGELMAEHYAQQGAHPDVIIPVPLHPGRLRTRGFNQALELARPIAARLRIPINVRACARTRGTVAQSDLPATQRAKNIKGAFEVRERLPVRSVAIVDDVMTTGATVDELARTLTANGVEDVQVWVCARALLSY
jgi:ComF family protein